MKYNKYIACSPNGVALMKVVDDFHNFLSGLGDISFEHQNHWIASVEIKTKVSPAILAKYIHLATAVVVFCTMEYYV